MSPRNDVVMPEETRTAQCVLCPCQVWVVLKFGESFGIVRCPKCGSDSPVKTTFGFLIPESFYQQGYFPEDEIRKGTVKAL